MNNKSHIYLKSMLKRKLLFLFGLVTLCGHLYGQDTTTSKSLALFNKPADSSSANVDSLMQKNNQDQLITVSGNDSLLSDGEFTRLNSRVPNISVQQMLKGSFAGAYVQEPSAEPGTEQYIYIHGLSSPILSKEDLLRNQPVVFLNGVPLITNNGMVFKMQPYDFNEIGPATNLFANLDPNDIESIKILKSPGELSKLGPIAANGAIWVTTKNAHSGEKDIRLNSYFGMVQNNAVTPVNANYENAFRQPFYSKYADNEQRQAYPAYLKDSTDLQYYGPANWTDLYFKNTPFYSTEMSLTGGTSRANFRFQVNNTKSVSGQDGADLERYGVAFFINMAPLKWLTVSSMINANRLERNRNKNIRDRLAEERYLPDLSFPLPPNKSVYGSYLDEFDKSRDQNKINTMQGYFSLAGKLGKFNILSKLSVDYNEGIRDVFFPSTLMANNNFVSNYFGYNQRLFVINNIGYDLNFGDHQSLKLTAGQSYQSDVQKYDYAFGYNTPNDHIKIHNTSNASGTYEAAFDMQYFPLFQKMKQRVASFYGQATYDYKNKLSLTALLRHDGSSNLQPNNRWITTPVFDLNWNVKSSILSSTSKISQFNISASYGRFGKLFNSDRFSQGPNYVVDASWPSDPSIGSYVGIAASSRPYSDGFVGYNIGWEYSDKYTLSFDFGLFDNRLSTSIDLYNNDDKNLLLAVPIAKEYGYSSEYKNGMAVNNKGIDLIIRGEILKNHNGFNWNTSLNFNFNKNKLTALPGGLQSIIVGDRKFEVGKQLDAFWLYQNEGIYNSNDEIPVNPNTGNKESFNGVYLAAGDAKWKDVNGDYDVNSKDKILSGHYLPTMSGGLINSFSYHGFDLSLQLVYAVGQKLLNQNASSHLDFINNDRPIDLTSVKEITFWSKSFDPSKYPIYNPWSNVVPYRIDQDLFLENASYLKLRSLTLGYDFKNNGKLNNLSQLLVYVTATNIFTISPFKDGDPEAVNYLGYYTGYNQRIPKTYVIGVKLGL